MTDDLRVLVYGEPFWPRCENVTLQRYAKVHEDEPAAWQALFASERIGKPVWFRAGGVRFLVGPEDHNLDGQHGNTVMAFEAIPLDECLVQPKPAAAPPLLLAAPAGDDVPAPAEAPGQEIKRYMIDFEIRVPCSVVVEGYSPEGALERLRTNFTEYDHNLVTDAHEAWDSLSFYPDDFEFLQVRECEFG